MVAGGNGNGRPRGSGAARTRMCQRCHKWKPVAAFVGKRGRVCVTCDECRAYLREYHRERKRLEEEHDWVCEGYYELRAANERVSPASAAERCGAGGIFDESANERMARPAGDGPATGACDGAAMAMRPTVMWGGVRVRRAGGRPSDLPGEVWWEFV